MSTKDEYHRASEELSLAVFALSTGTGSLLKRIRNATIHLSTLAPSEIPPKIAARLQVVLDQDRHILGISPPSISDEEERAVAKDIFEMDREVNCS